MYSGERKGKNCTCSGEVGSLAGFWLLTVAFLF